MSIDWRSDAELRKCKEDVFKSAKALTDHHFWLMNLLRDLDMKLDLEELRQQREVELYGHVLTLGEQRARTKGSTKIVAEVIDE